MHTDAHRCTPIDYGFAFKLIPDSIFKTAVHAAVLAQTLTPSAL